MAPIVAQNARGTVYHSEPKRLTYVAQSGYAIGFIRSLAIIVNESWVLLGKGGVER